MAKKDWSGLGLALGAAAGYLLGQQGWVVWQLSRIDVRKTLASQVNQAAKGVTFSEQSESDTFTRIHSVEDGIERIVYRPKHRRFATPIIMQHGMWHGAWCWQWWQELLAAWGWESHAHSLPGHGLSPVQRPIARCTLDYYLAFLQAEMAGHESRPVLMGHSMGGALTQWYLKYVGDDLPAAILVAPWVSHSMILDGLIPLVTYDPLGVLMMLKSWDATPLVRPGADSAARFLVGPQAAMPLERLQPKLGPESAMVLYQHNPPFWSPAGSLKTPLLWIAGAEDPLLTEAAERRSANFYGASYLVADGARHNVMMEHNYRQTAARLHHWLEEHHLP